MDSRDVPALIVQAAGLLKKFSAAHFRIIHKRQVLKILSVIISYVPVFFLEPEDAVCRLFLYFYMSWSICPPVRL